MLSLSSPVLELPRVGNAKAEALGRLGMTRVRDLLFSFPRRYEDFSHVTSIASLEVGRQMVVRGRVRSVASKVGFYGKRRLLRIFVEMEDETGILQITWFNLRFLERELTQGRELYVAGTVEKYKRRAASPPEKSSREKMPLFAMRSPALEFVKEQTERVHTAAITPVYAETRGITSRFIRYQVKHILPLIHAVPEYLPRDIIERNKLLDVHTALRSIHFPGNQKELEEAKKRLRFDELFFLQLAALVRRAEAQQETAYRIPISTDIQRNVVSQLPFSLTGAQQKALAEIMRDLSLSHPMNRLLQGDVGSGKSALALLAARFVLRAGYTVVYLAPTDILARQQHKLFHQHVTEAPVKLLVGALKQREKQEVKTALASIEPMCIIGTQALLQEDVHVENMGLAIIDEQHRFGVMQRKALRALGASETVPHLLSMTATPIPRTLNLSVYGDLDVSILDEAPPGREVIETSIVLPSYRNEAIIHVLERLHEGEQAYVVAPLIEESDRLQVKSAVKTYEEMKKFFPGVAVGLLHGQMKSEEKDAMMRNFVAGAIQMLVSTAVVEVGMNIQNATCMIIEGAERFGLAQLHQLRGRVGRSDKKSFCYLFPSSVKDAHSERLSVIERTTNGFRIAEEDLRLRGPGEMYGVAQSGFDNLHVASLLDYATIKLARTEAETILKSDPHLDKYPILKKKVEQKNLRTHFE